MNEVTNRNGESEQSSETVLFHFHFQMKSLDSHLDFERHRQYLIRSLIGAGLITLCLALYSSYLIGNLPFFSTIAVTFCGSFVYTILMSGAHLVISFLFIFLLLNTLLRFRQLNQFLVWEIQFLIFLGISVRTVNVPHPFHCNFSKNIPSKYCFAKHRIMLGGYEDAKLIKRLGKLHAKLTDVIEMINRCYSLQV